MRLVGWLVLLVLAFALGTIAAGWWAVPLVGLVAGLVVPGRLRPTILAPVAAGLAWLGLLGRAALADGFGTLVGHLEKLLPVPPAVLYAATLLFPMLIAAGAALAASAFTLSRAGPESGRRSS